MRTKYVEPSGYFNAKMEKAYKDGAKKKSKSPKKSSKSK